MKECFYQPGMQGDVQDWCRTCATCATLKTAPTTNRAPLLTIKTGYSMQVVKLTSWDPCLRVKLGTLMCWWLVTISPRGWRRMLSQIKRPSRLPGNLQIKCSVGSLHLNNPTLTRADNSNHRHHHISLKGIRDEL